jgi:hypothetical protein
MEHQFQKHYTREEARALLPQIRKWLHRLARLRLDIETNDRRLEGLLASGQDLGGDMVNKSMQLLAEIKPLLLEFQSREIFIKDMERGLIDFPALIGGREVFLCWEKDDEDIEFWHDIDSGYAGREPL